MTARSSNGKGDGSMLAFSSARRAVACATWPARYSYPLSDATLVGGGPDVAFLERGDVELKGIEGPHRLFAVDLASSPTVR